MRTGVFCFSLTRQPHARGWRPKKSSRAQCLRRLHENFEKLTRKKTHWAREGGQKSCFRPRNAGIFSHFSWYFGLCFMFFCRFSACIDCILTRSVRCVYNMDIQVCIMHDRCVYRYQKGICPHGQCVVRACRTFLSCSVCQKRASSRAQCVFLDFFFRKPPTAYTTLEKIE